VTRPARDGAPSVAAGYERFRGLFRDSGHAADYDRTRFGGFFEGLNQRIWRRALARLLAAAAPRGLVLDLPCGTGRLAPIFRRLGVEAVGADLSEAMLKVARSKGSALLLAGEAERLPLRDGAVDGVVSLRFLSHPPEEARARILREMARVSRRFVIVDLRYRNPVRGALRALRSALSFRRPKRAKDRPGVGEIRAAFAAAGFDDVRVRRLPRLFSDNCLVLGRKVPPGSQSDSVRNPAARPSQ